MKLLVLDDRADILENVVRALSGIFEVSGAKVTSAEAALEAIKTHQPEAILLDIQLNSGTEGVEVAKKLQRQGYQGLVIGHSSFSLKEQKALLGPYGVRHFASKGSISILLCLKGLCSCGQVGEKSEKEAGGIDLLMSMHKHSADSAFKRALEDKFSIEVVGEGERAADKIRDLKPKVVVYEAFAHIADGYGAIAHDWHYLRAQDPELPELADLNVSWVMLSWGQEENKAKERGHGFIRLPFRIAEFCEALEKLLAR